MLNKLNGAKTFLFSAALALCGLYMAIDDLLTQLAVMDLPDVPDYIIMILGGGTAASLRDSIRKLGAK